MHSIDSLLDMILTDAIEGSYSSKPLSEEPVSIEDTERIPNDIKRTYEWVC